MNEEMTAATTASPGLFRNTARDAVLPLVTVVQCAGLVALTRAPWAVALIVVALHVWWTSNTVAHIHLHTPIFSSRTLDRAFSLWLSALTFIPQTIWKQRHLFHHAGEPVARRRPRLGAQGRLEIAVVVVVAVGMAIVAPRFLLTAFGPGVVVGLLLCQLQGAMEHMQDGGAVSHYGALYNFFWFNDGHHVEHHLRPTEHWTKLSRSAAARASAFPPFLRWLERLFRSEGLEGRTAMFLGVLERLNFGSGFLRARIVEVHRRALASALGSYVPARVAIVGGGLFPRTVLALRPLLPGASITVIDASAQSIEIARRHLGDRASEIEFVEACWDDRHDHYDLVIFPLAYVGDRTRLYRGGRSLRLVHDWVWRGRGPMVSALLLKRLNVVEPA